MWCLLCLLPLVGVAETPVEAGSEESAPSVQSGDAVPEQSGEAAPAEESSGEEVFQEMIV